jgi:hypothetical protein
MHQLVALPAKSTTLTVKVDPLRIPRGHRALPRGGVHTTPRKPNRSKRKRSLRSQLVRDIPSA